MKEGGGENIPSAMSHGTVPANNQSGDTLYLCNFRVSVDGDWLCLKEVDGDQDSTSSQASSMEASAAAAAGKQRPKPPDSLAITPELDRLEKIYPNYPVGSAKG